MLYRTFEKKSKTCDLEVAHFSFLAHLQTAHFSKWRDDKCNCSCLHDYYCYDSNYKYCEFFYFWEEGAGGFQGCEKRESFSHFSIGFSGSESFNHPA